jgi:hypothetical protein
MKMYLAGCNRYIVVWLQLGSADPVPFDEALLTKSVGCINVGFWICIHDAIFAL